MERLDKEIVVSEGNKPFWVLIIAACMFAFSFVLLYQFEESCSLYHWNNEGVHKYIGFVDLASLVFCVAVRISMRKTLYIDFMKLKLKTVWSVGLIAINFRSTIPELQYVSVFRNYKEEIYEVNVWYQTTKYFNIGCFENQETAFNFGIMLSDKLNIDLLDATERGDSKWVEKVKPENVPTNTQSILSNTP